MDLRDIFVGSVAMALGVLMIYTALVNQGWCFQMKVARVIAESKGQAKARTFIGSVGALILLLGLYTLIAPMIATQILQTNDQRGSTLTFADGD